ncbi:MAG TPA: HAMP domain-containing sensor histidine kinase [Terriglobia bacterium]|jgi:signal transduction histidine kinase
MSLNRALSIFVVTVAILAVGAGVSLVLLTTYLHRATIELEGGLHGVRLAQEMQIDLLSYVRAPDASEKVRIERDLRQKLRAASEYGGTAQEDRSLKQAAQFLTLYFAVADQGEAASESALQGALNALRQFVDENILQANSSLSKSEQLDDLGHRIGITVAVALVIGAAGIMLWLHRTAFRPVFEIRDAMKNFAGGQRDAHAAMHGPEEFRSIAAQFNEMSGALARQHQNQAAFLAAIAHDLRNPISALKLSTDILSGPAATPDRLSGLMGVIKRQIGSLDRMVADLLDSAKIEAGYLELRFEELDARDIAQDTYNLYKSASPAHEFALAVPESPVRLCCDRLRIEQVLNNLLSNAFKYSPGGGRVTLSLQLRGNEGMFQVSDQGLGIPKEDIHHIFEPFRRVRPAKMDIPGVGLGLSVAQRIVQAHGGRIQVETEIAKGTKFSVHLPLKPAQYTAA